MITLYQYPRLLGVPNMSSFCLKIETWLRMTGIKYDIREVADPRQAPKGKLPFIHDDEIVVADSSFIIDYLKKKHGVTIDQHLSLADRAVAHAFEKMLEEHLYWALIYNRWVDDNWVKVREAFFSTLPAILRGVVPMMVQKNMKKELDGHGLGRHSKEEIYDMANRDIKAISDFMGNKRYLMGDQMSTVDASLFALLCNFIDVPLRSPMKDYVHKCENLVRYKEDMGEQLFPEYYKSEPTY